MKSIIAVTVFASLCLPAQAQLFSHNSLNGAAVGAVAGAIIGNNSGHGNGARGAAIGAGAGLLLGAAVGNAHHRNHGAAVHYPIRHHTYYAPHHSGHASYYRHGTWYRPRPVIYVAPAPIVYGSSYYDGYGPSYGTSYGSSYNSSPSYASNGLVLGGIAGAIIGNNSGHGNGLRGAAIGAGAGLLLGAIMDNNRAPRQVVERPPVYSADSPSAAPTAAPQNVTIINNYYSTPSTPMSSANSLFGR